MAKNKKKKVNLPKKVFESTAKVVEENIGDYNMNGMKIFGANVQLARAIPDVIDGFKPVGRRVLYAITKIAKADKKRKKVLPLIGAVIQIHPHGDSSIEDIIKDFSKEWELTYPLIEIKGNNGTAKGGEAAAARYLEARLSDYAYECYFKEWDDTLVEMRPSYNQEHLEPTFLISKFPDILLRPATGFTFGVSTTIPSYNMEEAFNAVIELIKDPDYDPILIPDLPSDCIILDEGNFPDICHNGRGSFKMRSEITVHEKEHMLVVESLPYKVNLADVIESIDKLRQTDIPQLTNMFDASDKFNVELQLVFKPGTDLEAVKNLLYKKTELEKVFATLMTYVSNYQIMVLNLKDIMQNWIDTRRVIKRKFIIGKFVTAQERIHMLSVLIDICSNEKLCDEIIHKIRRSKRDEIIDTLTKKYDITTLQAKTISKMRVEGFSATSLAEYRMEKKSLEDDIKKYDELIKHPKKIDKIIIKELEEAIGKFNKPRRCRVVKYKPTDVLDTIPNNDYILVFTKNGFVKKLTEDTTDMGKLNDEDEPIETVRINNRDSVVLFDDKGMIHTVNVYDIPESDKGSKGKTLSQYARIKGKIVSVFAKSSLNEKDSFLFVTKKGMIKKTDIKSFGFKSSILSIVLKPGDELVSVKYVHGNKDVMIFTKLGFGSRFKTNEVSTTSRMTTGVIGIDMPKEDEVIGMCVIDKKDTHFAVLTSKGFGKLCDLDDMNSNKRRSKILKLTQLVDKDIVVDIIPCNLNSTFLVVLNNDTCNITADDFSVLTRNHFGKKVVAVRRGESIIKFIRLI